ncbi:MAG: glycosyl hydrolase 108 family protein [Desulfocurvibacter africanus]
MSGKQADPLFEEALAFVLSNEGGYVRDPRDPGGETKYGISRRSYPGLDIANLTREQAAAIYRRDFWDGPGISRLPRELALPVFDAAVNAGCRSAVRWLQEALNAAGENDPGLTPLGTDGELGPLTLERARQVAASGPAVLQLVRACMLLRRIRHYLEISERVTLRPFLRGWLGRTLALDEKS